MSRKLLKTRLTGQQIMATMHKYMGCYSYVKACIRGDVKKVVWLKAFLEESGNVSAVGTL